MRAKPLVEWNEAKVAKTMDSTHRIVVVGNPIVTASKTPFAIGCSESSCVCVWHEVLRVFLFLLWIRIQLYYYKNKVSCH